MGTFKHEEHSGDLRRREAHFNQYRDEILRESSNAASLIRVRDRVLSRREVQQDPVLAGMLRAYAEERIASARRSQAKPLPLHAPAHPVEPVQRHSVPVESPHSHALEHLHHLEHQFDDYLAHHLEAEARGIAARVAELRARAPDIVPAERIAQLQTRLEAFAQKRQQLTDTIRTLTDEAIALAREGDEAGVKTRLQRLASIHASHPYAFDDEQFESVRRRIHEAGEGQHRWEAIQALMARERSIAIELKRLAATIHQFHQVARTLPHDQAEFRKAEAAYHHAVADVKGHDADWLAVLILESLDLLAGAATPKAQAHIDAFVNSVRAALSRMRREIKEIQGELGTQDARE